MNIYTFGMNTPLSPQVLLEKILQIQHMEHGSLCVLRQGPNGPYYNLNSWENGKNDCRYIPQDKVPKVRKAIEGYQHFQHLIQQYAEQKIEQTRAELGIGIKKKSPRPRPSLLNSFSPKIRKSSS